MIRFGLVLPSWIYSPQRAELACRALATLCQTWQPSVQPHVFLILKPPSIEWSPILNFAAYTAESQPEHIGGTEQTLAYGTELALDPQFGVSHIVWLGDDALFHPNWLRQLEVLILRHPAARAWSVYRSAHAAFHKTLSDSADNDVLVSSVCGHGMTFSREEWKEWGVDWRQGVAWPNPYAGDTLDLHHAWRRPGERWVTRRSYIEHTGREGVHCTPAVPEYAQDFVGVEGQP